MCGRLDTFGAGLFREKWNEECWVIGDGRGGLGLRLWLPKSLCYRGGTRVISLSAYAVVDAMTTYSLRQNM